MTFSESEKEAAPDTTPPPPSDVIKPPRGVVHESGGATQQEGSMSPASMSPASMSPASPTASDDDPFLDRSRMKEPSAPELSTEDRPDSTDSRYLLLLKSCNLKNVLIIDALVMVLREIYSESLVTIKTFLALYSKKLLINGNTS